jgi:transcriptional regulator with XRE-family HTH domain
MDFQIDKIGTLIRDERIRRGMTQEALGEKVGVGKAQISKIESGKGLTIKTVTKVLDALDLSASIKFVSPKKIDKRIIGYILAVTIQFAKVYNLTVREASNYLNRYKGLEFLMEHYEVEHSLSFEDSVEDLARVCYNNGGGIL